MFTAPPALPFPLFHPSGEAQMWLLDVTICFHGMSRRLGSFSYQPSHSASCGLGHLLGAGEHVISLHKQMLPSPQDEPWGRPR